MKNSVEEVFHVTQIKHLEDFISPYGWSCRDTVRVLHQDDKYVLVSVHPSLAHEFLKILPFLRRSFPPLKDKDFEEPLKIPIRVAEKDVWIRAGMSLTLLSPTSLEAVVQNPSRPLCLMWFMRSTGTIVHCRPTQPSAACDRGLGPGLRHTAHIDSEHTVLGGSSRHGFPTDCSYTAPPESDFPPSV